MTIVNMNGNKEAFDTVMANAFNIGGKKIAYVPISLIGVDETYQRREFHNRHSIERLKAKWDDRLMDPIIVSPHAETNSFAVVDGDHRTIVAKELGRTHIVAVILDGMPEDKEERSIEEAKVYASQGVAVTKMRPEHLHKANLKMGVEANRIVQRMMDKYGVQMKNNRKRGLTKANHIASFSDVLRMAAAGEENLDGVFKVITEAGWNLNPYGFSRVVMRPIWWMLQVHPDRRDDIIRECISYFRGIDPKYFVARGNVAYPMRKEIERITLALEDYLCEKLDMPIEYLKDKDIERNIA